MTEISSTITNPHGNDIEKQNPPMDSVTRSSLRTKQESGIHSSMVTKQQQDDAMCCVKYPTPGHRKSCDSIRNVSLRNRCKLYNFKGKDSAIKNSASFCHCAGVCQYSSASKQLTYSDNSTAASGHESFFDYQCVLTDMPKFLVSFIPKVL